MLFALLTLARQEVKPVLAHLPLMGLAGLCDTAGTGFYALAAQVGRLDVAAVLSSLSPAATVLLARFILHERLTRRQGIGVLAALLAVVLIAS
jgi:drug/metabolite transporter (DMT)-like permease